MWMISRECRAISVDSSSSKVMLLMNLEETRTRAERPKLSLERLRRSNQAAWNQQMNQAHLPREAWLQLLSQEQAAVLLDNSIRKTVWWSSCCSLAQQPWQRKVRLLWLPVASSKPTILVAQLATLAQCLPSSTLSGTQPSPSLKSQSSIVMEPEEPTVNKRINDRFQQKQAKRRLLSKVLRARLPESRNFSTRESHPLNNCQVCVLSMMMIYRSLMMMNGQDDKWH